MYYRFESHYHFITFHGNVHIAIVKYVYKCLFTGCSPLLNWRSIKRERLSMQNHYWWTWKCGSTNGLHSSWKWLTLSISPVVTPGLSSGFKDWCTDSSIDSFLQRDSCKSSSLECHRLHHSVYEWHTHLPENVSSKPLSHIVLYMLKHQIGLYHS